MFRDEWGQDKWSGMNGVRIIMVTINGQDEGVNKGEGEDENESGLVTSYPTTQSILLYLVTARTRLCLNDRDLPAAIHPHSDN